jgi:hypothetical protein
MGTQSSGDPIDRALARCSVKSGSSLEKLVRQNAFKLFDADGADNGKIDAFILEQRGDPFYASCFTAPPGPAKAAGIDTLKLTEEQRRDIAAGKIVIEPVAKQETATIAATVQRSEEEFAAIASGKAKLTS